MDETWRCCARTKPEPPSYGYTRIKKVIMNLLEKLPTRPLLSSILLLLAAAVLNAAESTSQNVRIKIDSILASNQTGDFDARLKPLEKQLKVLKYKSYRLIKEETQNIPSQGSGTFDIPGSRSLSVSPQDLGNQQI